MGRNAFDDLLANHGQKGLQKEDSVDWVQQRDEWLAFIKAFYSSLEEWFQTYKDNGALEYEYTPVQLTEDSIGTYETSNMLVQFAGQNLKITPIGTLLIGTKGRIDMEGARGRVQFILADKNSRKPNVRVSDKPFEMPQEEKDWQWKIVLREAKRISFVDFNEDNFFDALMEIVNV